jgi:hypothetical protein
MALFKLTQEYFENLTLTTHPRREFHSASLKSTVQEPGMFGTVNVFAQRSDSEKEAQKLRAFDDNLDGFEDASLEAFRLGLVLSASDPNATVFPSTMEEYLDLVTSSSVSERKKKFVEVIRFEPSFRFTADTERKNVVRNVLFPYYRDRYSSLHWTSTNYNTLNFFTGSNVPSDSTLIYPASADVPVTSIPYSPPGAFTFDFYINPRYTADDRDGPFKAGTIFHMSSSYAVSLVTGSNVELDGRVGGYRIMLQLSSSAEIPPSEIPLYDGSGNLIQNNEHPIGAGYAGVTAWSGGTGTATDLIFLSSENSLDRNTWHHVAVRWGTSDVNHGTGSFVVDGIVDSTFIIPSASVIPQAFDRHHDMPDETLGYPNALFVGNFYEGRNNTLGIGTPSEHLIEGFFHTDICYSEGLRFGETGMGSPFDSINSGLAMPAIAYSLDHPLNAEVHELKIWNEYRTDEQVKSVMAQGLSSIEEDGPLLFYVPPLFVKESRERDILQTPFQDIRSTTDDPFNVAMSFGVGGHLLNLENFVREFVREEYPRLLNLSGSRIDTQAQVAMSANDFMFSTGSIRKRNLTILPCDNGNFKPGFSLLSSGTYEAQPSEGSPSAKYTNDFGSLDLSKISLDNLVPQETLFPGLIYPDTDPDHSGSFLGIMDEILGAAPENPGVAPGSVLTIFQRTRDSSSNEVVFFDASNLFYGNKIEPGTYKLVDNDVTGSGGKVKITIQDDGRGGLYRADAKSKHATWNEIGSIIYEEGVAVIKTPVIPYFGKEQFSATFAGEQNIHILEIHVPCGAGQVNSSSNPQYKPLKATDFASEIEKEFVYISGLNFHDENLNIIARTNLATPVVKRDSDGYVFRVKVDF